MLSNFIFVIASFTIKYYFDNGLYSFGFLSGHSKE